MVEFWQLDYGYSVRIIKGNYAGEEAIIEDAKYGFKSVGVRLKNIFNCPNLLIKPLNLEIISRDDEHNIKKVDKDNFTFFDASKYILILNEPEKVLDNSDYFTNNQIKIAKDLLKYNRAMSNINKPTN